MKTSKQLVYDTLNGRNTQRAPRQLWSLAWANMNYPKELQKIIDDFPDDIVGIGVAKKEESPLVCGYPCEIGEYTDDWGCTFVNVQRGVIGEVKNPLVVNEDFSDYEKVHIPYEWLTFDIDDVNANIAKYAPDKFTAAGFWARPFEQLQFIRGTENLYIDLMDIPPKLSEFIEKMHSFYCSLMEKWCKTNIDTVCLMDDWGSQNSLLINPAVWRKVFKPLYKDYIQIAKKYGKKSLMHSDGYTLEIIPDLIEIGLDMFNTQIFCIGLDKLAKFKGKITFYGEIDRQHLLPRGSIQDISKAVKIVKDTLWKDGFCIAQCEFGAGANPANVYEVFRAWNELTNG